VWGAINHLEAEGVVEIVPRQGVYFIKFDPEKALEGMAARLAAERGPNRQLGGLKAALEKQRFCLEDDDTECYAAAALAFHEKIVDAAANKTLARLLGSVYAQIQAMRAHSRCKDFPTRMPPNVETYERVLDAITARDPDRAEREARTHIQQLGEEVKGQAESGSGLDGT